MTTGQLVLDSQTVLAGFGALSSAIASLAYAIVTLWRRNTRLGRALGNAHKTFQQMLERETSECRQKTDALYDALITLYSRTCKAPGCPNRTPPDWPPTLDRRRVNWGPVGSAEKERRGSEDADEEPLA